MSTKCETKSCPKANCICHSFGEGLFQIFRCKIVILSYISNCHENKRWVPFKTDLLTISHICNSTVHNRPVDHRPHSKQSTITDHFHNSARSWASEGGRANPFLDFETWHFSITFLTNNVVFLVWETKWNFTAFGPRWKYLYCYLWKNPLIPLEKILPPSMTTFIAYHIWRKTTFITDQFITDYGHNQGRF